MYSTILQKIILRILCFIKNDNFIKELQVLRNIANYNSEELNKLQKYKLNKLIKHSVRNVPFYREYFKSKSVNEITLKNFPIINKSTLRDSQKELISDTENISNLLKHVSSGSSGEQSEIFISKDELSIHRATQILWWEWAGYKIGQPILQTGINPSRTFEKKIKDFLFRTKYLSAFYHSVDDVVKALNSTKNGNVFLSGYPSSLYVLAKIAQESKIDVKYDGAVCFGDKLFDHYKKKINSTFNVNVKETYGCAEMLMIAAQSDIEHMYIMTPNVYLEILDDNGNEVDNGQIGNVVVTNLNSYAMPLIRYRLGDLAIKLPFDKYPDNRKLQFPLLEKVIGRDTDIVKTANGKYLVVHSFTGIFEHYSQIKQFCVIQNDLNGIMIKIVPGKSYTEDVLDEIKIKIHEITDQSFCVDFITVNKIDPSSSGKPQMIQSFLPKSII